MPHQIIPVSLTGPTGKIKHVQTENNRTTDHIYAKYKSKQSLCYVPNVGSFKCPTQQVFRWILSDVSTNVFFANKFQDITTFHTTLTFLSMIVCWQCYFLRRELTTFPEKSCNTSLLWLRPMLRDHSSVDPHWGRRENTYKIAHLLRDLLFIKRGKMKLEKPNYRFPFFSLLFPVLIL